MKFIPFVVTIYETFKGSCFSLWKKLFLTILVLILVFIFVYIPTYALDDNRTNFEIRNSTDGRSLDIVLEYSDDKISNINNSYMQFRILFIDPKNDKLQRHIDYDFVIFDINKDKEIYRLSNQSGHPLFPIHSNNGIGFIPVFSNLEEREYIINIIIHGITFNPIKPELAQFNIIH